jgi:hypothetical protein
MPYTQDELDRFVCNARETLETELKAWIDPKSDEGIIKIARACIALFNNNGGRLIIGIGDDGEPDKAKRPKNIRSTFSADVIQGIVGKFSSHQLEVVVEVGVRDGKEYPIVCVPSGVESPVFAKSDLKVNDKLKIVSDTIYARTLSSNRVSSAQPRAKDMERVIKACFDNREADIGAFARRHLSGIGLEKLGVFLHGVREPDLTPSEQATRLLDSGKQQCAQSLESHGYNIPAQIGTREAAFVIVGEVPNYELNQHFLWQLNAQKPDHSGWSPWMLLDAKIGDPNNAHIVDDGYERLMFDLRGQLGFTFVEFWRIAPPGFYHLRGFEYDLPDGMRRQNAEPGTQIDFRTEIARVAEVISIALAFARALGCNEAETSLAFAFRWSGLANRQLTGGFIRGGGASHQKSKTTSTIVPLETPQSAIAPHVDKLVAPLFALFGGMVFEPSVIREFVNKALGQRF